MLRADGEMRQASATNKTREDLEARGEGVERGAVHASSGREVAFELPERGLGLSREALDARLARWARERGTEHRFGARVRGLTRTRDGFRVGYSEGSEQREIAARAVVGAWGRWDALDRVWDRNVESGRRYLAWSRLYEPCEAEAAVVVTAAEIPGSELKHEVAAAEVMGRDPTLTGVVQATGHRCAAIQRLDQLRNPLRHIVVDPVDHETVGREQAQYPAVFDRL